MKARKQLFHRKAFVLLVVTALSLWGGTEVYAQRIKYTYDNSGNRLSRQKEVTVKTRSAAITVYPNPTSGMLKVDIPGAQQFEKALIALYDVAGKLLQEWNNVTQSNAIDLAAHSAGEYMLQITLNDEVSSWKIIKE